MPPTIEGVVFKSSGAVVPASRPTKPTSISRAFLLCWITIWCWRALRASVCLDSWWFSWGCGVMLPLRMLAVHSERMLIRSLSMPANSCLMTLGCALARMHMASTCLQGITPLGRAWHRRFPMVGVVLLPCHCSRRRQCLDGGAAALAAAAAAVAHHRHLPWWMKGLALPLPSLRPTDLPASLGPGGESVSDCLWKVLAGKQVVAQAKLLWHCLVEVDHHIAVDTCDCGVPVSGCQDTIATRVHLLLQAEYLGSWTRWCKWHWGWWCCGLGGCWRRSGPDEWWTYHSDGTCAWTRRSPVRCGSPACHPQWLKSRVPWPFPQWSASLRPAAPRGKGPGGPTPCRPAACGYKTPGHGWPSTSWCARTAPPTECSTRTLPLPEQLSSSMWKGHCSRRSCAS